MANGFVLGIDKESTISAEQTTTSAADGGVNIMTFTLGNGKTAQLQVKNGSKGSAGAKGDTGAQGPRGYTGSTGTRGSRWNTGTAITGTSTTATAFSGSGIADALVNDMYLNTSTMNTYRCTVAGSASSAKWVYVGCIKGATGPQGPRGYTGSTGAQGPKGDKGDKGDPGDSGTIDKSTLYITAGKKSGTTLGYKSTAEGYNTTASGSTCHAEGTATEATGGCSHAEGNHAVASGQYSHAGGYGTIAAGPAQTAIGNMNIENSTEGEFFIIGKGVSYTRANCFRVNATNVYGGTYNSSGADYAEYFEWMDGNPNSEDRRGLFVTLDGNKIRLASSADDFILGIVSGYPSVIGDSYEDQWNGMYLVDIFGAPVFGYVDVPEQKDYEGNVVIPAHKEYRQKLNPDYDNSQTYIPHSKRPEWSTVGMMGKLVVVDDGSCVVNGWCRPTDGGKGTKSETQTKFRVMERLNDNHVRVLVL